MRTQDSPPLTASCHAARLAIEIGELLGITDTGLAERCSRRKRAREHPRHGATDRSDRRHALDP